MKLSDRRMHWPVGAFISFLGHFAHLSSVSRLVVEIGAKRKSALSTKRAHAGGENKLREALNAPELTLLDIAHYVSSCRVHGSDMGKSDSKPQPTAQLPCKKK